MRRMPVESCHSLSSWGQFTRAQMWTSAEDDLEFSWDGDDAHAVIKFTRNGCEHSQEIRLTKTRCAFGGVRNWFVCPSCGARVGKLYLPCTIYFNGNRTVWWWCRRCYKLSYLQNQWRARRVDVYECRSQRIAENFLGEITDDWIGKRKGQHQKTFELRANQYEDALAKMFAEDEKWGRKLMRRLGLKL